MPKLSAVLSDADYTAADDSLKTFYAQNTETKDWFLEVDEPGKLDFAGQTAFTNLKAKLDGSFKERDEAKKALKDFTALGKTADEIKAALEANRPEEVTKLIEKYEAEKESLRKSFEEPLAAAKAKADKLQNDVQTSLTNAAIGKLRNEFDLNETADYVLRDFIKVVPKEEGSDEFVVRVFENGQPAMVAGQEMKPDQLIKGFQEGKKFSAMFNTSAGAGTGLNPRQGGYSGTTFKVSREASKANPSLYQQAKEQAAKAGGTVEFTD
jgi:DNA-binding transcriptional MerR regulator